MLIMINLIENERKRKSNNAFKPYNDSFAFDKIVAIAIK